jgi:hypothetical protein
MAGFHRPIRLSLVNELLKFQVEQDPYSSAAVSTCDQVYGRCPGTKRKDLPQASETLILYNPSTGVSPRSEDRTDGNH